MDDTYLTEPQLDDICLCILGNLRREDYISWKSILRSIKNALRIVIVDSRRQLSGTGVIEDGVVTVERRSVNRLEEKAKSIVTVDLVRVVKFCTDETEHIDATHRVFLSDVRGQFSFRMLAQRLNDMKVCDSW